ncbi:hypothetical protein NPX13_g11108 [Xylaria arbuscula]|uniref:Uncharacterized protein n=1 Tax=Xylaria arbuscula TaxID=114810 RepID=A0A9W8N3I1_9PEZI|nr:hypothetical protein NPX13_g11108 [Xylaria arbuscula]
MLAPTVETVSAGLKAPLQNRVTREVFPTPWDPSTTILASSEDMVSARKGVDLSTESRNAIKDAGTVAREM